MLSLGEDLLFDPTNFFVEVEELLDDRPQAIFYGPPGTGKTWAALQLAVVLAGDESRTKLVQFHPSYAYEDFIEGWRPTKDGSFNITDGPLKRMAADAAAAADAAQRSRAAEADQVKWFDSMMAKAATPPKSTLLQHL